MPCVKSSNGKWKLGSGEAMYTSKENCEKAYKAYLAKKYSGGIRKAHQQAKGSK